MAGEKNTVPITGLWLRTMGNQIQVLFERDGKWYMAMEHTGPKDLLISQIVEVAGLEAREPTED
jgi:hypothetical protein